MIQGTTMALKQAVRAALFACTDYAKTSIVRAALLACTDYAKTSIERVTRVTQQYTRNRKLNADNKRRLVKSKTALNNYRPQHKTNTKIFIMSVLAMQVKGKTDKHDNIVTFDTDSASIGVDNRCTACLSDQIDDFIGPLKDCQRAIKGFGGTKTTNI